MDEALDSRRRGLRILLNVTLVAWFGAMAFWFGPNFILFHKLSRLSPADFAPVVEKYCVPAVRAIKVYQQKNGRMPKDVDELGPPFSNHSGPGMHIIDAFRPYDYWTIYNHTVSYD